MRYRGYYYDTETGLYYLQSRYYNPDWGRFISQDDPSYEDGAVGAAANLYAYCGNNSVNMADPNGDSAVDISRTLAYWLIGNPFNAFLTQNPDWLILDMFYAAGFTRDGYGIYHTTPNCWQQIGGYNDFYDVVFNYATSMARAQFQFSYGGTSYILWAWKGNYLNLGAGAEMGIYSNKSGILGQVNITSPVNGHWLVDTSLAMPMTMTLKYKGITIIPCYANKTWWITGFNPHYQGVKFSDLTVTFTVTFTNQGMYNAFMGSWNGHGWKPAGGLSATYTF